jgi:hypothetical protein
MTDDRTMTLERLRTLLDAYGAAPERWPAGERAAAEALLARSPEAQRWQAASRRLDALLDAAPPPRAASPDLARRILAATPRRPAPRVPRVARALATLVPFAAAAGLALWLAGPGRRPPAVDYARLDAYEVPTDALLAMPAVDLDAIPTFGCTDAGLGCLDAEELQERTSALQGRVSA